MKKITLFLILLIAGSAYAQQSFKAGFSTDTLTIKRTQKDQLKELIVTVDASGITDSVKIYSLELKVNTQKTTLAPQEYEVSSMKSDVKKLGKEHKIYFKLKADSIGDRLRYVNLELALTVNDSISTIPNVAETKSLVIRVEPISATLKGYEYLAYLGTNFDLVEGVQAKDLFFAANIYHAPERTRRKRVGFYLSIYGNRALSINDSISLDNIVTDIRPVTDSTFQVVRSSGSVITTRVTDNLGAYISPLIKLNSKQSPESTLNLYYSPSLEFVYRRTRLSVSDIQNISIDTTIQAGIPSESNLRRSPLPQETSETFNEYSFNLGAVGLFLVLENKRISVRVHGSVGYASNYFRDLESNGLNGTSLVQQSDLFFSGRAWITEPKSGITLQAEVTNSAFNPRPFFVATLSKAFDFRELGSIFKPITSRD